jgi:4-hydroxy-tetrahydrodipicolinate synthase
MLPVTPDTRRKLERLIGELGLLVDLAPTGEDLRMF